MGADSTLTHAYIHKHKHKNRESAKKGVVTHTVRGEKKEGEREQSLVTRLTTHREGGRLEGEGEWLFFFLAPFFV